MHFSVLMDWLDKGSQEQLTEEMLVYLEQLTTVNSLWNSCHSPQLIIKKLIAAYPDLNFRTAKSRMEDAFQYFYMDSKLKKEAWRNVIFEKMMKLVDVAILSAKTVDDYTKASLILQRAYLVKQLDKEDKEGIPDSIFNKPIKIYATDTSDFPDLPQHVDRNLLGKYIDEMNLTEDQKLTIKQP